MRICEGKEHGSTKVSVEGGGGGTPGAGADSLQAVVRTMVTGCPPVMHEVHGGKVGKVLMLKQVGIRGP